MTTKSGRKPFVGGSVHSMGFFTWMVPENILFGDPVFAALYEIPMAELVQGVSVERILDCIAGDDRATIARNVHQAIVSAEPSSGMYHIRLPSGGTRHLLSFGRCIRDEMGVPTYYTGAVMDASAPDVMHGDDPLLVYCRSAHALALGSGNDLAARYLHSAITVLGANRQ